jgi:hypothetical protein
MFGILHKRKQAKMQWLQDPNQSNVDNPNNVRREASIYFWSKNKEYLKANTCVPETDSKTKNITDMCRGNNGFKKGYNLELIL